MVNWKAVSLVPAFLLMGVGGVGEMSVLSAAPAQPAGAWAQPPSADNSNNGGVVGSRLVKLPDATTFVAFRAWMEKYDAASAQQKPGLETEGVRLATERREAMAKLIPLNPQKALEYAVYPVQRQALPDAVKAQLETFVEGNAYYSLDVTSSMAEIPVPNKPAETQKVWQEMLTVVFTVKNEAYRPYFYGKRGALVSMANVPFYGIAIGKDLAIHESPLRLLAKNEASPVYAYPTAQGTSCPICKKDASKGLVGVSGTSLYYFDSAEHAEQFRTKLWAADNKSVIVE